MDDRPKKKLCYIVHPISGVSIGSSHDNETLITEICKDYYNTDGTPLMCNIPISPLHTLSHSLSKTGSQLKAYAMSLDLMMACDEVHVYGDWQQSRGCMWEVMTAFKRGMPITFFGNARDTEMERIYAL